MWLNIKSRLSNYFHTKGKNRQSYKCSNYNFISWVEQRPAELLSSVERCVEAVTEKLRGQGLGLERLAGVGITNQRETTILWHRGTGRPLYNAVVWCDARYTALWEPSGTRPR